MMSSCVRRKTAAGGPSSGEERTLLWLPPSGTKIHWVILNREQQASFVRIVPDAVLETTRKDLQMGLTGLLCKSAGELVPTEGMAMGWCKEDPGNIF